MLIESALLKKKYVLLAHFEKSGRSPYDSLIRYEHIAPAVSIETVKYYDKLANLGNIYRTRIQTNGRN